MKLPTTNFLNSMRTKQILVLVLYLLPCLAAAELPLEKIKLPKGFSISIYADGLSEARGLVRGENGTIFVGSRGAGKVYALIDADKNQKVEKTIVVAKGLNSPVGVALLNGDLYVAEISRILRFPKIEEHLDEPPKPLMVRDDFPSDAQHGWKFIAFGPDQKLYVPIGAPCNVCNRTDKPYASLLRMNADGTGLEVFAKGIRNTVGFAWHPQTNDLWFTDNGRDRLGDDRPPDELNRAPAKGLHFGFPFCHGDDLPDPEFGAGKDCKNFTSTAQRLGPHVAALGMRFYTGNMFPPEYKNQIFIAEHGSWDRSAPVGYRVMQVRLKENIPVSYEVFAEGWLQDAAPWGRPVDVLVMPDGALLISDDRAGAVYRVSYAEPS